MQNLLLQDVHPLDSGGATCRGVAYDSVDRNSEEWIMLVENLRTRGGNPAANQFIIHLGDTTFFQSYDTIIARRVGLITCLDKTYWNYSRTTSRYRNQFLGEGRTETERKIKSGLYTLSDLNHE